jgi:hypothetical protein
MKEENKRTENGKSYIDVIETTTYEEVTVKYPFGFEKKKLVKVQDDTEATDKKERKPLTKKQKAGIGLGVLIAAALGGRALAAHGKHNEDEDYDDEDYDEDVDDEDEDDQDDSED